jgi:hypothetical protein
MIKFIFNYAISLLIILSFSIFLPNYFSANKIDWIIYVSIPLGILMVVAMVKSALDDGRAVADGRFRTGYRDNIKPDVGGDVDIDIMGLFIFLGLSLTLIGFALIYLVEFRTVPMLYSYLTTTPLKQLNYYFYFLVSLNILNGFFAPFGAIIRLS